ncbi:uncharacterized protein LOC127158581 [Labeo rohita]|uniref:uncharacterized protein LOC127158581 n=1 Tax=Labeo rohita TaxID=84645 RepID=UPI0021E25E71|nr:uncharacterized protein LOC127158581 [Labeo rohita]
MILICFMFASFAIFRKKKQLTSFMFFLIRMASPYSRPSPIRVKCVLNRRNAKTLNFKLVNGEIRPGNQEVTYLSALSTGVTYYIKNYTVSSRYGQQRLFMGPNTTTYKTAPLTLTFDAEKMAKDALIPPSVSVTGDEQDLFSRGCYLTLEGTVEHMQVPRMTTVRDTEVPILDLGIRSGSRVLEVSLWRDQALTKLQINDKINICHLRANAKASKFNSTAYTTVEVCNIHSAGQLWPSVLKHNQICLTVIFRKSRRLWQDFAVVYILNT